MSRPEVELLVDGSPCAEVICQRRAGGLLDRDAVVDAVMAVAELMSDTAVLAVDVNPLIALPHGAAVVDCKVVVAGSPSTEDETAASRGNAPAGTGPLDKATPP